MGTIVSVLAYQSLQNYIITLQDGETATVSFAAPIDAKVDWFNGGVSVTVSPLVSSSADFSVAVEDSLVSEGDHWVPDPESPITEAGGFNTESRLDRMRFTNTGDDVKIVLASPAKCTVELS